MAPPDRLAFATSHGDNSLPRPHNPGRAPAAPVGSMQFSVDFQGHSIRGIEIAGTEPAVVLLHGFPDNLHLYDELYPLISGRRRIVAFDFIGWGTSDKPLPPEFEYSMESLQAQIEAVIDSRDIASATLVAHDASGIPAIDFAAASPERVDHLILLNTFYGLVEGVTPPYAIELFANPALHDVESAVNAQPAATEALYRYQIGLFLANNPKRDELVDRLWSQFPEALPAFIALNDMLFAAVTDRSNHPERLAGLTMPVSIVWGGADHNLTTAVGEHFADSIPGATLTVVPDAGHFVQLDAPRSVADALFAN